MAVHPNPVQWLRYAVTGQLPREFDEWVLHDVTGRTWLLRHTARFLLYLSPLMLAVLIFLPAPLAIRLGCVVVGIGGAIVFSFGYTVEGAERRIEKAGYPYGTAERTREERAMTAQREGAARRREKAAARRARR